MQIFSLLLHLAAALDLQDIRPFPILLMYVLPCKLYLKLVVQFWYVCNSTCLHCNVRAHGRLHGLRRPREELVFTTQPKIQSQSQIFRYGRSIFGRPHWPNFSDIFDLCLHWVSVVRAAQYVAPIITNLTAQLRSVASK